MSGVDNIEIEQGADWEVAVIWADDATGDPVDVTGYSAEWVARQFDGTLILALADGDGIDVGDTDGALTIYQPAAVTGAISDDIAGTYNLFATSPAGVVTKLLRGTVVVPARVDPAP